MSAAGPRLSAAQLNYGTGNCDVMSSKASKSTLFKIEISDEIITFFFFMHILIFGITPTYLEVIVKRILHRQP